MTVEWQYIPWFANKYHPNSKKIIQLDKQWNKIKIWDSIQRISDELWILRTSIVNNCRWYSKSSGWFIFKYLTN